MDATRQFRMAIYYPLYEDGYDASTPMYDLEEVWYFMDDNEHNLFVVVDALTQEVGSCILDFKNLTANEFLDVHEALS